MYGDFERIFKKYADTRAIAAYAMGADGRRATDSQKKAFTDAFTGYISRKYGKRFREFIGGRLEVQGVSRNKNFYDVATIAYLKGEAPFSVNFHVSDNNKFYNMYIEGVNMLLTERTEIGAMLDRRRGDIDALIADLRTAS
jgi:phospholipid transport system substrate-binding protein